MATKAVKLSKSYKAGEVVFDTVVLREPTFVEVYMEGLGKPQEWQPSQYGNMVVTYASVIDAYLQKIVAEPGYELIGGLSAVDSMRLEAAVCDFFIDTTKPSK